MRDNANDLAGYDSKWIAQQGGKDSMEYILRPVVPEHLERVITWISTPQALKLWGGPALTFPPRMEKTWQEIGATDQNTFSLLEQGVRVAGLGQILFREPGTVHLARIIVEPTKRGRGLGRILCQQLLEAGFARHPVSEFTLNVYRNNAPAIRLYTSLGFAIVSEDLENDWFGMRLPLGENTPASE